MQGLIGQTLGGYRIVSQIGKGGMATVFKAYQPSLDRYVAVKVMPSFYAEQDETFLKRFRQEAKAIASLRHPNILIVMDYGEQEGTTYLVMEFVEAGTLSSLMGRPMAPSQMASLIGQISGALDYAHQQGVVHRDIKPSNILLPKPDWPLLTDFGLAKIVGGSQLTQSGTVAGTPAYMSPEQGRGEKVDQRTDIYSLGIVLYEMATGVVPFEAETPMAVIVKHIIDPLPLPRSKNSNLAEAIELVILKALAKDAKDRYQRVSEMAEALKAAVGAMPEAVAYTAPASSQVTTLETAPAAIEAAVRSVRPVAELTAAEPPARRGFLGGRRGIGLAIAGLLLVIGAVGAVLALSRGGTSGPALDAEPEESRTLEQLVADGYASLERGDVSSAITDFEAALDRDPENLDRYFDVARAYFAAGDHDAVLSIIQEGVDLAPEDPGVNESAGWFFQELGFFEQAVEAFRTALELDPQAYWLFDGISDSYEAAGLSDEAVAFLTEALANPAYASNPPALATIGWNLLSLSLLPQAEQAFNQSIAAGADFPDPWQGLAEVAYKRGDIPVALGVLDAGMQVFPEHAPFFELAGDWNRELGASKEAEAAYQRAIELDPANSSPYADLASLYSELGMLAEAEQLLLQGMQAYPEVSEFYSDLGSYYADQGRYAEAIPLYETLITQQPEEGWWYAELADLYVKQGDADRAMQLLREASARNRGDPWLHDTTGWVYYSLGDCEHALEQWRLGLEIEPSLDSAREGIQDCGG